MTIHLFVTEALVAAALYTRIKQGGGHANQRMPRTELTEKVAFLSQLFRGEFIFPAGEGLAVNLEKAVASLQNDEVIQLDREDDGITYVGLTNAERTRGRENYDFYCFLIWPFIEAAWLGAVSLASITPPLGGSEDAWVDFKRAQETVQLLGKTLYHQGDLSYFEAVNKEALKNAYTRFEEEGIVLVAKSKNSKLGPRVRLAPDWTPQRDPKTGGLVTAGRLWDFTEGIAQCRLEGKNRRDGATVSKRVLLLTDKLASDLFHGTNFSSDEITDVPTKKIRRRSRL
jgi:hypothetical protein